MGKRVVAGAAVLVGTAALLALDAALGRRDAVSALCVLFGILGWCELSAFAGLARRADGGGPALFLTGFLGTAWFLVLGWRPAGSTPSAAELGAIGLACFVALAFASAVFRKDPPKGLQPVLVALAGVILCGYLLSFPIRIYRREDGMWLGVFFLIGVKGTDVAAYLIGSLFGRRRIFPVSPKKTLEGAAAAVAFGALWFGAGSWARPDLLFPWPLGLAFGALMGTAAQVGDLSESLIKRYYRVKDSGNLLPGMGGVLDVLDSFLYCGFLFWGALEVF